MAFDKTRHRTIDMEIDASWQNWSRNCFYLAQLFPNFPNSVCIHRAEAVVNNIGEIIESECHVLLRKLKNFYCKICINQIEEVSQVQIRRHQVIQIERPAKLINHTPKSRWLDIRNEPFACIYLGLQRLLRLHRNALIVQEQLNGRLMCAVPMYFKCFIFGVCVRFIDKSGYFFHDSFRSAVALSGQAKEYKSSYAKWIVLIIILARIVMERFLKMTFFHTNARSSGPEKHTEIVSFAFFPLDYYALSVCVVATMLPFRSVFVF